ncbi:MAG: DUF4911 domain-containing protein, partial [Desulfovibrio sp.]|nr:DUF4911 domain-containing protein [Desulfovibrio sp.]
MTTDIQPKNAFLLEPHENLAYFTVLERKTAMLKLVLGAPPGGGGGWGGGGCGVRGGRGGG